MIKLSAVAAWAEPDGRQRWHRRTRFEGPCDLRLAVRAPPLSVTDVDRLRKVSLFTDPSFDLEDRQQQRTQLIDL